MYSYHMPIGRSFDYYLLSSFFYIGLSSIVIQNLR